MKLIEKYPEIKIQFISEKNEGVILEEIGLGSTKPIWWKCEKGPDHIWEASPNQRTSGKKLRGCPICAGKKVVKSNSLEYCFPEITKEWNYERNGNFKPDEITTGSNKKVWWKCSNNQLHEWQASPKQRTAQNNTCPICNSLAVKFPKIAKELHPTLNSFSASELFASSHKNVWWKCNKGFDHVWESSVNSRTSMVVGCPICAGYRVVKSNSLAYIYPEIAIQWDFKKNGDLMPDNVYARSSKKVWWKCSEGGDHEWQAQIKSRANGIGCPICSGRKTVRSNSLASVFPEIAELFHNSKNIGLTPYEITPYSNTLVWWKCSEGDDHEWQSTVANVVNGSTCPVCMGRKITDKNNLAVLHEELMEEWDHVKNSVNPSIISPGSKKKAWWICKRDNEHTWYSTIRDRTAKHSGCPICSIKLNISETKMLDLIKEILPNHEILYRYRPSWLNRMELDVFIPLENVGIEYQGIQHFKPIDFFGGEQTFIAQVKRDKLKKKICQERGVTLIEVYYDEHLSKDLILEKLISVGIKKAHNNI